MFFFLNCIKLKLIKMKKYIYFLTLLFSISSFGQEIFWYNVLLEVKPSNTSIVENLVDEYYSDFDFTENTSMSFSNIALKGQDFKETHVLSFTSSSSESLAELRSSLSGNEWDLYIAEIQKHISSARVSAGKSLGIYNQDIDYPIGQAWIFDVNDASSFVDSFEKLMKSFNFEGYLAIGQIIHGVSDGENMYIYGTYKDLNTAFNFGPKNESESKAFDTFSKEVADERYTQSFTRVLIKKYE